MRWAQITLLVWMAITLLIFARDHGKPRKGTDNFWIALLACTIQFFLIYCAGGYAKIFN